MGGKEVNVEGVEDDEKGKAPGNTINDDSFSLREELIDDRAKEEQVNQRPMPAI